MSEDEAAIQGIPRSRFGLVSEPPTLILKLDAALVGSEAVGHYPNRRCALPMPYYDGRWLTNQETSGLVRFETSTVRRLPRQGTPTR